MKKKESRRQGLYRKGSIQLLFPALQRTLLLTRNYQSCGRLASNPTTHSLSCLWRPQRAQTSQTCGLLSVFQPTTNQTYKVNVRMLRSMKTRPIGGKHRPLYSCDTYCLHRWHPRRGKPSQTSCKIVRPRTSTTKVSHRVNSTSLSSRPLYDHCGIKHTNGHMKRSSAPTHPPPCTSYHTQCVYYHTLHNHTQNQYSHLWWC